jgi:hypothetical protein
LPPPLPQPARLVEAIVKLRKRKKTDRKNILILLVVISDQWAAVFAPLHASMEIQDVTKSNLCLPSTICVI